MKHVNEANSPWQIIRSQIEYKGRKTVLKDRLRKPTGDEMDYTYILGGNAVAVLAFVEDKKVVLTRQYRHPIRQTIYDLPAGGAYSGESCHPFRRKVATFSPVLIPL